MATSTVTPSKHSSLRADAEARLRKGAAPPTEGWSLGVGALTLLHKLASTPADAEAALKLLHELQVHQIELDLQHEQWESAQREKAEELAYYQGLYELAPMAYLVVSVEGNILGSNIAGAGLLGLAQTELRGRNIATLLTSESRPPFLEWLRRLPAGGSRDTCEVKCGAGNRSRPLRIFANSTPGGETILMVLVESTDGGQSVPRI